MDADNSNTERNNKHMSLIRYHTPDTSLWRSLDRWANLRDEFSHLFEGSSWPSTSREAQLFSGWTPALDLYQTTDDVMAVVELPGMRKEDIEISLHDGMLTISGERKDESAAGRQERPERAFRRQIPPQRFAPHASRFQQGQRQLQGWHSDGHSAESGGGQAQADQGQRQLIGQRKIQKKGNNHGYFSA